MIEYFKKTRHEAMLKQLDKFMSGCWINAVNPTKKELGLLSKETGIDVDELESGLDPNEIPYVDIDEIIYLTTKDTVASEQTRLITLLIIIGKEFILTLSAEETKTVKDIKNNVIKITTTHRLNSLIKLLLAINMNFERATLSISRTINKQVSLSKNLGEKDLNNLLDAESVLNNFVSTYHYLNLVYQRLIAKVKFFEEDKEIIEELIIEAQQGYTFCKGSLKKISNLRGYYLILLSNKLNKSITLLTLLTIFLAVPAAISGIYGMNVSLPFQGFNHTFPLIILFIMSIWLALLFYFKKSRMI